MGKRLLGRRICAAGLSVILGVSIVLAGSPETWENGSTSAEETASFMDTDSNGFTYLCYSGNGECTLLSVPDDASGDITIPSLVYSGGASYNVTAIGDEAFRDCDEVTGISFPSTLRRIGNSVFYDCDGLTGIILPDSVTAIGDNAFYYCAKLTDITLPQNLISIGESAFRLCARLTGITIPDGTRSIAANAFYGCSNLQSITIPNSVTEIGADVFRNCSNVTIYCNSGSAAAAYAQNNNKKYVLMDVAEPTPNATQVPQKTQPPQQGQPSVPVATQPQSSGSQNVQTSPVPDGSTAAADGGNGLPVGTGSPAGQTGGTDAASLTVKNVSAKFSYKKSGFKQIPAVKITWSRNSSCQGYEIKRKNGVSGKYTVIKTITKSSTVSYVDTSVAKGISYYYCVCAYGTDTSGGVAVGTESKAANATVSKKVLTPQIAVKRQGMKMIVTIKKAEGTGFETQYRYQGANWEKLKLHGALKQSVKQNLNHTGFQLRLRTYVKVSGKVKYSAWSKAVWVK